LIILISEPTNLEFLAIVLYSIKSVIHYYFLTIISRYSKELSAPRKILLLSQTNAHKSKLDQLFDFYSFEQYSSLILHDFPSIVPA